MNYEDTKSVIISAIRIRQPIGDIFVGSIPARKLVEITDFDIRSLVEERGIDSYIGIQRELDKKRVSEIAQYVRGPDATFRPPSCSPFQKNVSRLKVLVNLTSDLSE